MKQSIMIILAFYLSLDAYTQVSTQQLYAERVPSTGPITWAQFGPGNAGFANMMRYHPTIPGLVTQCPDMWNIYQSDNNGTSWYSIKDYDGNGDFYHIRDLYYSYKDANFGVAIESSRLWTTNDLGKTWTHLPNCPWYKSDAQGYDKEGWKKKVAAIGLDPNDIDTWYVAGGQHVRGQEWLSCFEDVKATTTRGATALNEGKLWKTINGGASWSLVNSGMNSKTQICRIIVHPENSSIVFAASNYGVYRSENGGTSWTQISAGKLESDIIMDMDFYYDKTSGKFVLYVIDQIQYEANGLTTACKGGIFKSSDNGNNWQKINGNLGLDINQLTGGVPKNYYKFIASWFGITETEAKSTYSNLPTSALQFFTLLSVDPSREGALYIGFADPQVANSIMPGRLWTTSNNGQTWTNTARLYEDTWTKDKAYWISRGNPYHENMEVGHSSPHMRFGSDYALRSMRGLAVGVDGKVMIVSDHSTMLSEDHGASWKQVDEYYTESGAMVGRGNSNLPGLHIAQDKRYPMPVLGSGEHNVWLPATDGPEGTQAVKFIDSSQPSVITMAFDPYDDQTIYATSSRQEFKQNIFRSTDGGESWENYGIATPATNKWLDDFYTNALTIDPINPKYMYHGITKIVDASKGQMGGFFRSEDYGKTFEQSNSGLPSPARISDIKFDPRDETRSSLFAAAERYAFTYDLPQAEGGLYHSSDRGKSWIKINTPAQIEGVMKMVFDHTNRLYITTGFRGSGAGLWYTDDFGATWQQAFAYAGTDQLDVSPFDHNLLVVTYKHMALNPGVFISRDRGLTWEKSNVGLVTPHQQEDINFSTHEPNVIWLANLGSGFFKGKIDIEESIQVVDIAQNAIVITDGKPVSAIANIIDSKYNGQTIAWKSENPSIARVDKDGVITPISKGNTKIWATTSNGRFADYVTVVVKDHITTQTQGKKLGTIKVTPNPTMSQINIQGIDAPTSIKVYNNIGQLVHDNTSMNEIDLTHLGTGLFQVCIETKDNIIVEKILVH